MHRGAPISLCVATVVAMLTIPAVATAASTYTVDGSAAAGCNAGVCRTLTAAAGVATSGDTIVVKPGVYTEPGKVTLPSGVTVQGTAGKTVITVAALGTAGDPTLVLQSGDSVDGLSVGTIAGSGPGVLVTGSGTTFSTGAILRAADSSPDAPAYLVDPAVAGGTSTLQSVTIVNGPVGATGQTQPAVAGNGASTLAIADSLVVSGPGQGPAVALTGNEAGTPNTILRSTLLAKNPAADALTFTGAASSAVPKALTIDSSALLGGSGAASLRAGTLSSSPGADTAGDITVLARHVTTSGAGRPFVVNAAAAGATPAGNIAVTFDHSIVHGAADGTVTSFVPLLGLPLLGAQNTATVTITSSDTAQSAFSSVNGKATIAVSGKTTTPDARLFVDVAKGNIHLRADAPVIDAGGDAAGDESDTDIDGEPRQSGAATDLGADEFVNRPPIARASVSPGAPRQGQTVSFDASASTDPEAGTGGSIATYRWDFGDGTTQETAAPRTTHVFTGEQTYNVTLRVVDNFGLAGDDLALPDLVVGDGVLPKVRITAPRDGRTYRLPVRLRFKGTASDNDGLAGVQLSVRRLSVASSRATPGARCVYLDGKRAFRSRACANPLYFPVRVTDGAWSYRFGKALRPRPGRYQVSVRAIDTNGNVSKVRVLRFRLR